MCSSLLRKPVIMLIVISLTALMCASCETHSPSVPQSMLPPQPLPDATPENVAELLKTSIEHLSLAEYSRLLGDDCKYIIDHSDTTQFGLPTDYLNHGEMLRASYNLFSGEPVTNFADELCGGISEIIFESWSETGPGWSEADYSSPFPGKQFCSYTVSIVFIHPQGANQTVAGTLEIYIDVETVGGKETCSIIGLRDIVDNSSAQFCGLGGFNAHYMAVDDPAPSFDLTNLLTHPIQQVECNAIASSDSLHGLHEMPYRWSFGEDQWSDWRSNPEVTWTGTELGQKSFVVEVRNRWLKKARAVRIVDIVAPYFEIPPADTADQLVLNFQEVYNGMNLEHLPEIYSPDFKLMLQIDTVYDWGLDQDFLDYDTELMVHEHLFTGLPIFNESGDAVAGVHEIIFDYFRKTVDWERVSDPDPVYPLIHKATYDMRFSAYRHASFNLRTEGLLEFYARKDGVDSPWILEKTVDKTGAKSKATEEICWGHIHALYR